MVLIEHRLMEGSIREGDTVQRRSGPDDLGTVTSIDPAGRCYVRWHDAVRYLGGGKTRRTYRTRLACDRLRVVTRRRV